VNSVLTGLPASNAYSYFSRPTQCFGSSTSATCSLLWTSTIWPHFWNSIDCASQIVYNSNWQSLSTEFCMAMPHKTSDHEVIRLGLYYSMLRTIHLAFWRSEKSIIGIGNLHLSSYHAIPSLDCWCKSVSSFRASSLEHFACWYHFHRQSSSFPSSS
jgi:hypothetical protein